MMFVPIVPTPTPPPSPRAQELGRRISDLVEQFRLEQPDAKNAEIHQALALAAKGVGSAAPVAALVAVTLGLLVAGFVAFFVVARSGDGLGYGSPVILPVLIGGALIVLVAGAAIALSFANRDR